MTFKEYAAKLDIASKNIKIYKNKTLRKYESFVDFLGICDQYAKNLEYETHSKPTEFKQSQISLNSLLKHEV